jgi:hypothetical protein
MLLHIEVVNDPGSREDPIFEPLVVVTISLLAVRAHCSSPTVGAAAEDSVGQVYFARPAGIQICEANGRVATILNAPEIGVITRLTFSGTNHTWLYVAENNKIFRRPVKVHGLFVSNPTKPPKPPL